MDRSSGRRRARDPKSVLATMFLADDVVGPAAAPAQADGCHDVVVRFRDAGHARLFAEAAAVAVRARRGTLLRDDSWGVYRVMMALVAERVFGRPQSEAALAAYEEALGANGRGFVQLEDPFLKTAVALGLGEAERDAAAVRYIDLRESLWEEARRAAGTAD